MLVSALAAALVGTGNSVATLPLTTAQASVSVASAARASGVPVPAARSALARAPYKRPVLRYLYAVGWITGTKTPQLCRFFVATGLSSERFIRNGLRRAKGMAAALKKAKVTEQAAVRAADAGFRSSCAA